MSKAASTIVIAAPPYAQSLDISGPLDVFLEMNAMSTHPAYAVKIMAMDGRRHIRANGLTLTADFTDRDANFEIDTLLIAGTSRYDQISLTPQFKAWLQRRLPGIRRYGSVCTGAFYLGEAGLLDHRRVTTHWMRTTQLAARYPNAVVEPDAVYICDGNLYTSAGITAGIDLALKLVEEDHGRKSALAAAQRLVVFLRRPGGQSQFSAHLAAQMAQESRIQAGQQYILDHLNGDLSIRALAAQAAMSVRNYSRLFETETGETPARFVEAARIDAARRHLEDSNLSLKEIAAQCGFSGVDIMRRAFLRRLAIGPSEYQKAFRA